jgi:hypothetical protein
MTMSIRAIYGWRQDPSQIKIPNPNRKCRRLPIDDEMCACGDITDRGEEPDYDLETLKLMTTIAAMAEKAATRKAKRSKRAAIDKADTPAVKKARTGPPPSGAGRAPSATVHAVGVLLRRGLCT